MYSTYFLVLRDCCWGAVAVVGVEVVGAVTGGLVLVTELFWLGVLDVESPAEVAGAGVACGEVEFGAVACCGDWGDGLKPTFCRIVTSCIRRLLT